MSVLCAANKYFQRESNISYGKKKWISLADLKPVNYLDFYRWHFPVAYGCELKGVHSFEYFECEGPKDSAEHMLPTVFALWNDNVASLAWERAWSHWVADFSGKKWYWANIPQANKSTALQSGLSWIWGKKKNTCALAKHLHLSRSINKIKLKWWKPEINYPSKGNVLENTIYGTITRMVRLSENPTIINLIFY